jgi:hypothetical protein
MIAVAEISDLRRSDPERLDGYLRKPVTVGTLERATSFRGGELGHHR